MIHHTCLQRILMEFAKWIRHAKNKKRMGSFLRLKYCDRLYNTEAKMMIFSETALSWNMGRRKLHILSFTELFLFLFLFQFSSSGVRFLLFPFAYADFSSKSKTENTPTEKAKKQETGPVDCSSGADEPSHMTWREHNRIIMAASSFYSPMTQLNIKSIMISDDCLMPILAVYLNWKENKSANQEKWGAHLFPSHMSRLQFRVWLYIGDAPSAT